MPITSSANNALRQDHRRARVNQLARRKTKNAVKSAKTKPSPASLRTAYRQLDRAAKNHLIHPRKAARLKSHLARLLSSRSPKPPKTPKSPKSSPQ